MNKRFQIEDLIVQDATGVVFRAKDNETGKPVAVRRFFPFGPDGGGLEGEEQTAYNIAVERLSNITHHSLRSVICGGCDPVDGIPFIATEWVEGESLSALTGGGPLDPEIVKEVVDQALEVSEVLSHVLAEEAVWVETDLDSIVVGSERSGRRFTFWISPLKWLGQADGSRGLEEVVGLAEELMGWKGRVVSDYAGRGLGGWVRWLRGAAGTTSLHEAREMLAASVGVEPPEPEQQVVERATQPLKSANATGSKVGVIVAVALGLAVTGLAGWVFLRKPAELAEAEDAAVPEMLPARAEAGVAEEEREEPAGGVGEGRPLGEEELASLRAAEIQEELAEENRELENQEAEAAERGGVISWDDHELLVQKRNQVVTVEGTLVKYARSRSKKTLYFLFTKNPGRNEARGSVLLRQAKGMTKPWMTNLLGKKIRITGKVRVQTGRGIMRPDIQFLSPAAVEVVDEDGGGKEE